MMRRRVWCWLFGHDEMRTLGPIAQGAHYVTWYRCRRCDAPRIQRSSII